MVVCSQIAKTSQKDTYIRVFITCALMPFCCAIFACVLGTMGIIFDYIIKNGRVVDPSQNLDAVKDIYIRNSRIVSLPENELVECEHVIDSEGRIVSPDWIDFYTHLFREGSNICVNPDMMIAQGTTAAVDAGSSGSATYEAFYKSVIAQSRK